MIQPINTTNGHEVRKWLDGQRHSGNIKHCADLRVVSVTYGGDQRPFFVPSCKMSSFEWKHQPVAMRQEAQILISMLHEDPISCPADCLNYRSVWRARLAQGLVTVWSYVVSVAKWFDGQSWQVKLGLIALVIFALTPKWVPLIVQLLNAYHGK